MQQKGSIADLGLRNGYQIIVICARKMQSLESASRKRQRVSYFCIFCAGGKEDPRWQVSDIGCNYWKFLTCVPLQDPFIIDSRCMERRNELKMVRFGPGVEEIEGI